MQLPIHLEVTLGMSAPPRESALTTAAIAQRIARYVSLRFYRLSMQRIHPRRQSPVVAADQIPLGFEECQRFSAGRLRHR